MNAPELKPCPFCGGQVRTDEIEKGGFIICGDGGCKGSGLWTGFLDESKSEAFAAWNTRTPAPDVAELVAALREASQRLSWFGDKVGCESARAAIAAWEGK